MLFKVIENEETLVLTAMNFDIFHVSSYERIAPTVREYLHTCLFQKWGPGQTIFKDTGQILYLLNITAIQLLIYRSYS
jgi:hypothetical protein